MDKNSQLYVDEDGKPVRFLGCTLWSKIANQHSNLIASTLNDYKLITINEGQERDVTVEDTLKWHIEESTWLAKEIEQAAKKDEKICVLTHHAPLIQGTSHPNYIGGENNSAFSSDLTHMMRKEVAVWLFGHTHFNSRQECNGTIVASNQRGYPFGMVDGFEANKYIEV
jgi:hypothetical protein